MANGSEPSGAGLVILTGLTIAAVVGLYAYDAIPRRSGRAPSSEISWPKWRSDPSNDRSYDTAPRAAQSPSPPAQETQPTGPRYQQPAPQQDNYPQDVPDEGAPPTQSQSQQPQPQPNGQQQPY